MGTPTFMRHIKTSNGFTVVELLIVIVVIAILAAVVIVTYNGTQDRSRAVAKIHDIKTMQDIVESYYAMNGSYPDTGGAWKYQRRDGDAFIPGVVPAYTGVLPSVTDGPAGNNLNNTYIYRSNGTDYKLDRLYQASIPSGEFANIPSNMKDGTYTDRWGVWSSGGSGF